MLTYTRLYPLKFPRNAFKRNLFSTKPCHPISHEGTTEDATRHLSCICSRGSSFFHQKPVLARWLHNGDIWLLLLPSHQTTSGKNGGKSTVKTLTTNMNSPCFNPSNIAQIWLVNKEKTARFSAHIWYCIYSCWIPCWGYWELLGKDSHYILISTLYIYICIYIYILYISLSS